MLAYASSESTPCPRLRLRRTVKAVMPPASDWNHQCDGTCTNVGFYELQVAAI